MFGMDLDIKIIPSSPSFCTGGKLAFFNINHYLVAHRWTNLLTRTIMTLEMGVRQPWPKEQLVNLTSSLTLTGCHC